MSKAQAIGLKDATQEEIDSLKAKYTQGCHVTHKRNGKKLPHNGVFYCHGRLSNILSTWARIQKR
jgi:hypothetical protein